MTCDEVRELLALAPAEMTEEERALALSHLAACPACRREAEGQARVRSLAAVLRTDEDEPPGTFEEIQAAVAAETAGATRCEGVGPLLAVLEELPPAEREAVLSHVAGCPACRRTEETQGWSRGMVRRLALRDATFDDAIEEDLAEDREALAFLLRPLDGCEGVATRLALYASGDLDPAEGPAVLRHLAACPACRASLARARSAPPLAACLREDAAPAEVDAIRERVLAAVTRTDRPVAPAEPAPAFDRHALAMWVRAVAAAAAILIALWVGQPPRMQAPAGPVGGPSADRGTQPVAGTDGPGGTTPLPTAPLAPHALEESRPLVPPDVRFQLEGWDLPERDGVDF